MSLSDIPFTAAASFTNVCEGLRQLRPGPPQFTERDVPDLSGRVCIVTGANTGVGKELARILYSRGARVWVAARDAEKARKAVEDMKQRHPEATGELRTVRLDLADLPGVAAAAREVLAAESRLDVLFNNAGVMAPPDGSATAQGYELQLGTNCVGPFLFTKMLTPLLQATAKEAPAASVRVVWVSSSAAYGFSPKGGFEEGNLDYGKPRSRWSKYAVSKAGNYYQGTEFARLFKDDGIVSVSLNPGNLHSELDRHANDAMFAFVRSWSTFDPIYGAYTELYAGLSPEITLEKTGSWIAPWGRIATQRPDLHKGSFPVAEGGTGMAEKFWAWCEEQVKAYL